MIPTLQLGQSGRTIKGAGGGGGGGGPVVSALLHFDGANGATTTTDDTGKAVTMFGSAQLGTAQSVFGGASLDNTGGAGRVEIVHGHSGMFPGSCASSTTGCKRHPRPPARTTSRASA